MKGGKDKDKQEDRPTFMITAVVAVLEVCMFVSTSKARTKHTVSSMIRGKRQVTTHDDDSNDDDRVDVHRGASAGWLTARIQHTRRPKRSRR